MIKNSIFNCVSFAFDWMIRDSIIRIKVQKISFSMLVLCSLISCGPLWAESPVLKLVQILDAKKTVNLLVIADYHSTVDESALAVGKDEWEKMNADRTAAAFEAELLKHFEKYPNFNLVDRSSIQEILKEQKFSMAVSNEQLVEIGKIKGVTHFYKISVRGTIEHKGDKVIGKDYYTDRLLEVNTGKIIGVSTTTQIKEPQADGSNKITSE